jgi:hypothetical protein
LRSHSTCRTVSSENKCSVIRRWKAASHHIVWSFLRPSSTPSCGPERRPTSCGHSFVHVDLVVINSSIFIHSAIVAPIDLHRVSLIRPVVDPSCGHPFVTCRPTSCIRSSIVSPPRVDIPSYLVDPHRVVVRSSIVRPRSCVVPFIRRNRSFINSSIIDTRRVVIHLSNVDT